MKKYQETGNSNMLVIIACILCLTIGFSLGHFVMPKTIVEEIPGDYCDVMVQEAIDSVVCEPEIVYRNVTIDAPIEPTVLDLAVNSFMKAVEDEEDEAGNDVTILEDMDYDFDFDDVSIKEISDDYVVSYTEDTTTVDFSIKLKFKDSHDTEKVTYNVRVTFEDGEDTTVEVM